MLVAESKAAARYTAGRHCSLAKGKWYSYFDGRTWTDPADIDIDDMVALKEAGGSGARLWSANTRMRYDNDLGLLRPLDRGH